MRSNAAVGGPCPGQRALGCARPIEWIPRLETGTKQDGKGAGTVYYYSSSRRRRQGTGEKNRRRLAAKRLAANDDYGIITCGT